MSSKTVLSPSQARQARAALRVSVQALATEAGLGTATIYTFERSERPAYPSTAQKLRAALERLGAVFTDDGGVRVKGD